MSIATNSGTIASSMFTGNRDENMQGFLNATPLSDHIGYLNCPQELRMFVSGVRSIPKFSVSRHSSNEIAIEMDRPHERSTIGGTMIELIHKLTNFQHDFTFSCFSSSTDKKITILGYKGELDNKLTPDEIIILDKKAVVLEYTTIRHNITLREARRIFTDKVIKYYQPLYLRKTDWALNFFVVLVTLDAVYTNMEDISSFWVDELVMRLRLAVAIDDKIREECGIDLTSHSELTRVEKGIKNHIESIPLRLSSGLILPEDKEWLTKTSYSTIILENQLESAMKNAKAEFVKNNADFSQTGPSKTQEKQQKKIEDLESLLSRLSEQQASSRSDLKRVIQIPLVVLDNGPQGGQLLLNGLEYPYIPDTGSHSISHKLFCQAFHSASIHEKYWQDHDYMEIDLSVMPDDERVVIEEVKKEQRRKYQRFTVEFEGADLTDLAMMGVGYKTADKRVKHLVDDKREDKKHPFSPFTYTEDIDSFVSDESLYRPSLQETSQSDSCVLNLFSEAHSASGTASDVSVLHLNHVREYMNSRLGRCMKLISDIGTELCISLRQNCKRNEWILKRIRGTRAYLMIHPTKSDSHIFYTLAWPAEDMSYDFKNTCVRDFEEIQGWCFTEIVSSNKSKLTNIVSSHAKMLTVVVTACEQSKFPLCEGISLFKSYNGFEGEREVAIKFANVCLLSLLHDKGFVDEAMSEARYLCMEGFVIPPTLTNPGKRLTELSCILRSRMHVWVYKKLISSAIRLIRSGGYHVQKVEHNSERRTWFGLFDVFTGCEYSDPGQLINSFYYNYLHNKDENPEKNSSYKIMKKILEWESKFPDTMEYLGKGDHIDLNNFKTMEFSPNLLMFCCDMAAKKAFPNQDSWKDDLDSEIIREISKITVESISTLKASAAFTELNMDRIGSRPRVMSAMKNLVIESGLRDSSNVALMLQHCLEVLHGKPGLMVDTFPKAQHGGFREILVLSSHSRVIQLIIESISRTICSHFPSEIMTHPERKLKTPGIHSFHARKMMDAKTITVCTSDDAKKWNQGHVVTKFMMMLIFFTKPYLHDFIISSLDLWLRKNIMIPNSLLDMMDSMTLHSLSKKPFANEVCNQMARCRLGGKKQPWMNQRSSFVTTRSGMLQGILHYTSSLFHTVVQETMPYVFSNVFPPSSKILVTPMQSSDDSSLLITSQVFEESDYLKNYVYSCLCFYLKHQISKALGIYLSSKSTIGTINIMEFNSEFFDHGSLIRPVDKWAFACTVPPESGSLYSRQEHFKSLQSAILEGGGSIILASQCQMAQGLLYYRMLGMSVNPVFTEFHREIRELRDPALGFFMLDDPLISGLGTCKFNLYMNLKYSRVLNVKYKSLLDSNVESKLEDLSEFDRRHVVQTLSTSAVSCTSLIVYGRCNRYNKLIQLLNNPDDWREQLDQNPELLYRKSENFDEYVLKIAQKSNSPGVINSLSHSNVVVRAIASASYILSRTVLSVKDYSDPNQKKTSLMNALRMSFCSARDDVLTTEDFAFLFPLHSSYEALMETKSNVKYEVVPEIRKPKRTKNDVVVFEAPIDEFTRLERVLRSKWFDHKLQLSKTLVEMRFQEYKKHLPWLRDNAEDTLKCSPFEHQDQLHDFIQKLEVSSRVVHLTCAPVSGIRGYTVLQRVIRNNQWPNYKLKDVDESELVEHKKSKDVLNQCIYQLSVSPLTVELKSAMAREVLYESELVKIPMTDRHRHPIVSLHLIQKFAKTILKGRNNVDIDKLFQAHNDRTGMYSTVETEELCRSIQSWVAETQNMNCGIMGHYSKPQRYNAKTKRYEGLGIWVGKLNSTKVEIHIKSHDNPNSLQNYIDHIKIVNQSSFTLDVVMLETWMKEHRCCVSSSSYIAADGESIVNRLSPRGGFSNYSSDYSPVVLVRNFTFMDLTEDLYHLKDCAITLDRNALRLTGQYRGGRWRTRVTLISYSVSQTDGNLSKISPENVKIKNPLWKYWCARTPLDCSRMEAVLNQSIKDVELKKSSFGAETPELMQSFLQDCFSSVCSRLNYNTYRNYCSMQELLEISEEELMRAQSVGQRIDLHSEVFSDLSKIELPEEEQRVEVLNQGTVESVNVFEEFRGYTEMFNQYSEDDTNMGVDTPPLPLSQRMHLVEKYLLDDWVTTNFKNELMGNALPTFLRKKIIQKNIEDKVEILCFLTGISEEECTRPEDDNDTNSVDEESLLGDMIVEISEEQSELGSDSPMDLEELVEDTETDDQPE